MKKIVACLQLMRPANIVTSVADILLGFSASGLVIPLSATEKLFHVQHLSDLLLLILSTIGLYGGGVVYNDYFDAALDAVERPERPIPSKRITKAETAVLGTLLFIMGIIAAFFVSLSSGCIAIVICLLALIYDWKGKHHPFIGPVNMGSCRGANLLLGISAAPYMLGQLFFLAFIPIVYIAAITMISRGEVHGGNKTSLRRAALLYAAVLISIILLEVFIPYKLLHTIPFLILFSYLIFSPLLQAIKSPQPQAIKAAVKGGIIALIVLDAAIATGFAGWVYGLLIICLLPLSRYLGKLFAIT